jgi:hypothetical protein
MTRIVLVLSVVLSFWCTSYAPATQSPRMCGRGSITVSGIVHGFATVQEEPSASPQSSFTLRMPSCGTADVLVSGPAPIFCAEGDKATVTGKYLRPSKLNPVPVINPAHVDCTPRSRAEQSRPQVSPARDLYRGANFVKATEQRSEIERPFVFCDFATRRRIGNEVVQSQTGLQR